MSFFPIPPKSSAYITDIYIYIYIQHYSSRCRRRALVYIYIKYKCVYIYINILFIIPDTKMRVGPVYGSGCAPQSTGIDTEMKYILYYPYKNIMSCWPGIPRAGPGDSSTILLYDIFAQYRPRCTYTHNSTRIRVMSLEKVCAYNIPNLTYTYYTVYIYVIIIVAISFLFVFGTIYQ